MNTSPDVYSKSSQAFFILYVVLGGGGGGGRFHNSLIHLFTVKIKLCMVLHMPLRKWSFEKKNGAIISHFADISFSVHAHIKNCQKKELKQPKEKLQ